MPQSILVPMDHSPPSKAALEHALSTHPEAEITVLHVIANTDVAAYGEGVALPIREDHGEEQATQLFDEAEGIAEEYGADLETVTEHGRPARTINEFAREHGIDHIVMGSHGRKGVKRLVFGSVAERVVRRAPVPVTVVR